MITEISDILNILYIVAGLGFLSSVIFALKLYFETDRGWYWLSLLLSAFFFAISQWTTIIFPISIDNFELLAVVQETTKVFAGLFFALSCFGIYKTMKEIRKRVE